MGKQQIVPDSKLEKAGNEFYKWMTEQGIDWRNGERPLALDAWYAGFNYGRESEDE